VAVPGGVRAAPAVVAGPPAPTRGAAPPLPRRERTRLFLYHKPRGLLTTHADPQGRQTIFAVLPRHLPRLLSVGRLDLNTEGLLLLTNDGGLARVLELPATGWLRRYRVRAHGSVHEEALARLRAGITIDGVRYGSIEASLDRAQGANVWLTFAMREGKNREVKNVLGHLGLKVNRLIRVSFGPFQLGELAAGAVAEVPTRVLREQLGERVAAAAGVDFSGPIMQRPADKPPLGRHPEVRAPAPGRSRPSSTGYGANLEGRATQDVRPSFEARAKPVEDGRERPVAARAPQRDNRKNRGSQKYRQRDAERLGEPALARRERKRKPGPERGKRR
jgi:23S rRNA pseudouridine2605 synthase